MIKMTKQADGKIVEEGIRYDSERVIHQVFLPISIRGGYDPKTINAKLVSE